MVGLFDAVPAKAPEPVAPKKFITAWSFSRLENFEKCPHRAFLAYVEKRPEPPTVDRTHAERGIKVHKTAEDYIQGKSDDYDGLAKVKPLLDELRDAHAMQNVVVEQEWAYDTEWGMSEWFAPDVWGRVKCDAVRFKGEVLDVIDWKTGKKFGNEVKHIQQGQLYAVSAFMRYPEVQVVTTDFEYVDKGERLVREYTRDILPKLLTIWDGRLRTMTTAQAFPAKPNRSNCKFCPYSPASNKGDGSCPWGVPA